MTQHFNILKPFLQFCKFLFLFPHKDYWQISDSWKMYSLIAYACFVYVEIISVISLLELKIFNTRTSALIVFSSSIDVLAIGIHVTNFVFKKESINNFLENIGHLYKNNNKRVSINLNFWTPIALVVCLIDLHNYAKLALRNLNNWFFIVIALIYLIVYTILMQFVYFLDFLKEEFQTLTNSIGNTETSLLKHVEEHWHLIELCHEVNRLYSKQLLLGMFRLFVILTLDSFYVIDRYTKLKNNPRLMPIIFPSLINFAWSFVTLLATAHTCELTKESADSFHTALSAVLKKNKTLKNEKLVFYLHMKPTVHLNADGFFSLGRHNISSVLAAALTYLVILIKINKPET